MRGEPDRFLNRLLWLAVAVALLTLFWHGLSSFFGDVEEPPAEPRAVLARGDLAGDEKATIELFERARDSVVFITTKAQVRDFWTRNVYSVPRGTGSGFVWAAAGHVVANYHVIENASDATVKLADGRDYKAELVGASPSRDGGIIPGIAANLTCWGSLSLTPAYGDAPAHPRIRATVLQYSAQVNRRRSRRSGLAREWPHSRAGAGLRPAPIWQQA